MKTAIWDRNGFLKTLIACIATASFLLWAIYQLLMQAKLGLPVECFFMAQVCVVLLIAPYLAAYAVHTGFLSGRSDVSPASSAVSLIRLSPVSSGRQLLRTLLISQVPLFCWIFLSITVAFFITYTPFTKILQMFIVLGVYSVSAAAVGIWGAQVFRDALFGSECAYLFWCVLIGGAFVLIPLDRYVGNIQPFISPVLHLNPLIAVCYIFEMDLFRTPLMYELVPIGSFDYANAPWYYVGFWQLLIGIFCFLGAWQIRRSRRYVM